MGPESVSVALSILNGEPQGESVGGFDFVGDQKDGAQLDDGEQKADLCGGQSGQI